jgi:hypothetical protein
MNYDPTTNSHASQMYTANLSKPTWAKGHSFKQEPGMHSPSKFNHSQQTTHRANDQLPSPSCLGKICLAYILAHISGSNTRTYRLLQTQQASQVWQHALAQHLTSSQDNIVTSSKPPTRRPPQPHMHVTLQASQAGNQAE